MNPTQAANMALGRLGVSQKISALDEASKNARALKFWFDHCRDKVLRELKPGFANTATALEARADEVYPGWAYVYAYPDECLNLNAVGDEAGMRWFQDDGVYATGGIGGLRYSPVYPGAMFPWKVAVSADLKSRVILSGVASAWAFYTARVTVLNVWTPEAVSLLAWCLASEAGGEIQADVKLIQMAQAAYQYDLRNASANSKNEAMPDVQPDSPSIQARL